MARGRTLLGITARLAVVSIVAGVAACADFSYQRVAPDEARVVMGPNVRANRTPMEGALACVAKSIMTTNKPRISVAVGDVKDYTGKYSQDEGPTLTQGGALMVYSALGKLGNAVQVDERFDTRIAELELAYTDRRQLGDGQQHPLDNGQKVVPWLPYFGGTILRSDYYIVGGITELNYNIQSGGAEGYYNSLGPGARVFTMNIGVDLRIVDTKTLQVVKTVSLEKQITGHEVTFGLFRFFGSALWDVNAGEKSQEPLQLGVRTALEEGVVDLISAVEGTDPGPCLANKAYWVSDKSAEEILAASGVQPAAAANAPPPAAAAAPAAAPAVAVAAAPLPVAPAPAPAVAAPPPPPPAPAVTAAPPPAATPIAAQPENIREVASDGAYTVSFDFGSTDLGGQSGPEVDRIAAQAAKGGGIAITITARDTENWAPVKRDEITRARIKAVVDALTARGIPAWRISIAWMPSNTEMNIVRDGSGFQRIARLAISRT